jgi:hypothetical protein
MPLPRYPGVTTVAGLVNKLVAEAKADGRRLTLAYVTKECADHFKGRHGVRTEAAELYRDLDDSIKAKLGRPPGS